MKVSPAKVDRNERINGSNENRNLSEARNMVVDKSSPRRLIQLCVCGAIEFLEEKSFEKVESNAKVDDENDGDNQACEGCQR